MHEPTWLPRLILEAVHLDQLREHGGLAGLRDEAALESALARPKQKWAYDDDADLALLAAAYGFGLATNHPFRDGNKRTAFLAMAIFLGLNGLELEAPEAEVVTVIVSVAAGQLKERQLADWVRAHLVSLRDL